MNAVLPPSEALSNTVKATASDVQEKNVYDTANLDVVAVTD